MDVWTPLAAIAAACAPSDDVAAVPAPMVVDLRGDRPDRLDVLRSWPGVVIGVGRPHRAVDVAVDGERDVQVLLDAHRDRPIATTALALLLRAGDGVDTWSGLVAESATYSVLQAGPEHAAWLARDGRRRPAEPSDRPDDGRRVRIEPDADDVHLVLERPTVHNAVDAAMQRAIVDAVTTIDADVRVVLRGDGPTFSSGGDLGEFGTRPDPATAHLLRLRRSPAYALASIGDRLTARVHGRCHGAGVELPAFASRVVAHPDTTFTLPEVGLGLVPGAGGTVSIPHRIGRHRAARWAMLATTIDASTALAWGLVDELDPAVTGGAG